MCVFNLKGFNSVLELLFIKLRTKLFVVKNLKLFFVYIRRMSYIGLLFKVCR